VILWTGPVNECHISEEINNKLNTETLAIIQNRISVFLLLSKTVESEVYIKGHKLESV
jgi:hypothetical protein